MQLLIYNSILNETKVSSWHSVYIFSLFSHDVLTCFFLFRFIDTALTDYNFINCNLLNNSHLSVISECSINFDYNIYLEDLYLETITWAGFMFPALQFLSIISQTIPRPTVISGVLALATVTSTMFIFGTEYVIVTLVDIIVRVLLMCAVNILSLIVVEGYPCHLR